jgi:hypothetical protein
MATFPHLTRIPRADAGDYEFILLHISSTGDRPMDLKIIGTENEQAYVLKGGIKRALTLNFMLQDTTG